MRSAARRVAFDLEAWSLSNLIQTLTKYFFKLSILFFDIMTRRPRLNSSSYRNLSKRPNVCSRKTSNPPWGEEGEVMILYSPFDLFVKKVLKQQHVLYFNLFVKVSLSCGAHTELE